MKNIRWQILLSIALISLSLILYSLHFQIFQDTHHIFFLLQLE